MCGIVGVMGNLSSESAIETVKKMNETIIHRGPDDEGFWATDGFGFGMRRLSIIDLSSGRQPIFADNGVGIVFNGEIYNYRELRSQLEERGFRFKTGTDTEVVLNLFIAEGIQGISRLAGMFAISLYDPHSKKAYLVRDRLGIKPLYYCKSGNRILFGSEIRALLRGLESKPTLNEDSLFHYFTLRFVPGPNTVWRGIKKLEPGTWIEIDIPQLTMKSETYWKLHFDSQANRPQKDCVGEFEKLFKSAVERQLVASDVPVGVLLSGGLDSSAIAATAVELGHENFHTFNVDFSQGGGFSESKFAQEMASRIGSQHHSFSLGKKEFLDFLPKMVRWLEEPLADLASIPLYFVCQLARQHVKVVLSGEGSDEVLAGYSFEKFARILELHRLLTSALPGSLRNKLKTTSPKFFDTASLLSARDFHLSFYWSDTEKSRLLKRSFESLSTSALIQSWYNQTNSTEPLDRLQQAHCGNWLVEDLLMKADKMGMANSLEIRVPFLEHDLVEWAANSPVASRVGSFSAGFQSKRVLRDYCRTRLPDSILHRPKQGFPVPAYQWLAGETGKWAKDFLTNGTSLIREYVNDAPVQAVLKAAGKGNDKAAHKTWSLIVFEYWLREWT